MSDVTLYLRCQPRARRSAGVPLTAPDVRQVSVSCWMAVDAVKFVHSSSLRIAARHSRVTTQRDWSATSEGDMALFGASVEVQWLLCCFLCFYKFTLLIFFYAFLISSLSIFCFSQSAKSDGRTCEYNNRIYQNGEIFRPNCKHQCTCMDGAVGCVSLCPHELTLPKLGCAKPRRVKVPGRCCEQLVCPEDAETASSVVRKHRKKYSRKDSRASENDLTNRNELTPVWRGESKSLPGEQSYIFLS